MKTAIDSSVLFAIFTAESKHEVWLQALIQAREEGQLVICEMVYAELAAAFRSQNELDEALCALGVSYESVDASTAFAAGQAFRKYRDSGGPRTRLIADFLIAAHALHQADRLASIDNGFFRRHFSGLKLLKAST